MKASERCPHPLCGLPSGACCYTGGRTERFEDCPCPPAESSVLSPCEASAGKEAPDEPRHDVEGLIERLEYRALAAQPRSVFSELCQDAATTLRSLSAKLEEAERERGEALAFVKRMASRAAEPDSDAFSIDPPEWAKDPFNGDGATTCGCCGAWMTVIRPGTRQCDNCSDGRDAPAVAGGTLMIRQVNRYRVQLAIMDEEYVETITGRRVKAIGHAKVELLAWRDRDAGWLEAQP